MKKNDCLKVTIQDLNAKGDGVAEYIDDGQRFAHTVSVPFTMPHDCVSVEMIGRKKGSWVGNILNIEKPSPERIEAKCSHFAHCGGCRWQHIPYEKQLVYKQKYVEKSFASLTKDKEIFSSIIPSSKQWQYRNKMEFTFSQGEKRGCTLGLFAGAGQRGVVDLTECHLVNDWFITALNAVRSWWQDFGVQAYYPPKDRGSLRTLTLREGQRTGDRMVILTVSGNPDYRLNKQHLESFVHYLVSALVPDLESEQLTIFLRIHQAIKGNPTNFYEMLLYGPDSIREELEIKFGDEQPRRLTFSVGPSSFFQPNTLQAENVYMQAMRLAGLTKESVVYDLYCGTGTLGISMAPYVKEVIGIELCPEAALDARTNAENNGLENVTILSGAVRYVLKLLREDPQYPDPDIVMIDPPRPGLDPDAMEQLITLMPPKIIYISCNPETQVENIRQLCQEGYRLDHIQPIDQFPHTYHIENIALLTRKLM